LRKKEPDNSCSRASKRSRKKAEVKINQYEKEHIEAAMKENLTNNFFILLEKRGLVSIYGYHQHFRQTTR
jgi:hypothetical protein